MDHRLGSAVIFGVFGLLELVTGRFLQPERGTRKDLIIELGATLTLAAAIVPGIMTATEAATNHFVPNAAQTLAHWPAWAMFAALLIGDDLTQYLWHRLSHRSAWLYRLHRAHHSGEYLSIRTVYRNNLFYYLFMPSLWISGVLLSLGFAKVYVVYYIVKLAVITGAHCAVPWDAPLLKIRVLRPIMWIVVRAISTPSTHSAHHGKHSSDGLTHYKGNFGNFLFLWDVLFGTAKITGARPEEFGLENVAPKSWAQELLWPFGWGSEGAQSAEQVAPLEADAGR